MNCGGAILLLPSERRVDDGFGTTISTAEKYGGCNCYGNKYEINKSGRWPRWRSACTGLSTTCTTMHGDKK